MNYDYLSGSEESVVLTVKHNTVQGTVFVHRLVFRGSEDKTVSAQSKANKFMIEYRDNMKDNGYPYDYVAFDTTEALLFA